MALGHKKLSSWYLQLAQNLEAGLPLAQALRGTAGPPAASLEAMARWIEGGGSIEQALLIAKDWLPKGERPFLVASAASARLPQTLRRLAASHDALRAAQLRVLMACAYPVGVLHLAILIFPIFQMIDWEKGLQWNPVTYQLILAATVVPLWGTALVLLILARRESPWLGRMANFVPFLRGWRKAQALSDFTNALSNLLDAGVMIGQAWAVAGQVSRSPELRAAGRGVHELIMRGEAPGLHLHKFACFPVDYVAFYRAGEINGQLDHNLHRIAEQQQERARHCLKLAAAFYSTIIFLSVAGTVAYVVVSFYAGYFNSLTKFISH
jgi:type II secretory pathway component PulF